MPQTKIPVTVSPELKAQVKALVKDVQLCVAPAASRAVDRSTICRLGIQDLVARYEKNPTSLATRLGLSPQKAGEA